MSDDNTAGDKIDNLVEVMSNVLKVLQVIAQQNKENQEILLQIEKYTLLSY
jgi:hypothetical protein